MMCSLKQYVLQSERERFCLKSFIGFYWKFFDLWFRYFVMVQFFAGLLS